MRPRRPLPLTLLMWLLAFWSGATWLVVLSLAFGSGEVTVSGKPMARERVADLFLPGLVPLAIVTGAAAASIALRRPWSRPALLLAATFMILLPALVGGPDQDYASRLVIGVLAASPLVLLLGWYLYVQEAVVTYYRALAMDAKSLPPERV